MEVMVNARFYKFITADQILHHFSIFTIKKLSLIYYYALQELLNSLREIIYLFQILNYDMLSNKLDKVLVLLRLQIVLNNALQ